MKLNSKNILFVVLIGAFFLYGYFVGAHKIFPFPQLLALKHYIENATGTFESRREIRTPGSAETYNTFLQRLFIKKIQIPGFSGSGGGISTTGEILYIVTNKGSIQTFSLDSHNNIKNEIEDVPMNFSGLIQSGHPYKNEFRMPWFRVNGVYSESLNNETHHLFVSHNGYDEKKDCITHNISRVEIKLNTQHLAQINDWNTIFTASPCIDPKPDKILSAALYPGHISGGAIANFDQNTLLVSVGDYNRHGIGETDEWAMDLTNPYGKFILVDKKSGDWTVYSMGNRNASGVHIDEDSVIWSVENGPDGGDELNIINKNENYGWPRVSFGLWYDPAFKLPGEYKSGTHPEYQKPVFSWIPSVAPSSIIKIDGFKFNYWKGDLLMGTMRDQSLHRLRLDQNNRVVYSERIHLNHRIRDMITLPDKKIALITDDGYLIIIEDGGPVFQKTDNDAKARKESLDNFDNFLEHSDSVKTRALRKTSKAIYQQNCATCHNLSPSNHIGPHLHELYGRKVGSVDNFNYSQTLEKDTRTWDPSLLKSFLENPEEEFPGTKMQYIELSPSEADSLIHFFEKRYIKN